MKRNVLIFGFILGFILAGHAVYMMSLVHRNPNFESNDFVGYAAMVIVFSLTFFGIRNYRNKQLNGVISFGEAFKTGALIALPIGLIVALVSSLFLKRKPKAITANGN